jgi:PAS domain S-box-containing protein
MKQRITTIKNKLMLIVMIISVFALILSSLLFTLFQVNEYKKWMINDQLSLAKITGDNAQAALAFDDPVDAEQVLNNLKDDGHILTAIIYSLDGNIFAEYTSEHVKNKNDASTFSFDNGAFIEDGNLHVTQTIQDSSGPLGKIYIKSDLHELTMQIQKNIIATFLISLISLLVCYLITSRLQRIISTPILKLSSVTDAINQSKDYSLKIDLDDYIEVKNLGDSFNLMLDKIQRREAELKENRDHLELRVAERTHDLEYAKEKLEEMSHRNELILNTVGEGIYGLDINGNVTFINTTAAKLIGFEVEEVLGKNSHNLIHHSHADGSDYPMKECSAYKSFNDGKIHTTNDDVFWRKDGTSFPVEFITTPIFENNQITGAVVSFKDITKRKETEAELIGAKEKAEIANQAKSKFLASMSHELRTPLNAIIGFAELIQNTPGLDEKVLENINIINKSGDHLLALINNILDMARIEAGKLVLEEKDIDLFSMVNTIITMLNIRAQKKDLPLTTELAEDLPAFIRVDELKLRQILINLIGNAIKFTEQGHITLKIDYTPDKNNPACGKLLLEVNDTGPGLTPEEINELCKPFAQTEIGRKQADGTGLGLSISRNMIELMGGKLKVKSQPGKGSSFSFSINITIVDDGKVLKQDQQVQRIAPNQTKYKVLVVEDIEFNRYLLCNLMQKVGFEVTNAKNGQEALERFKEFQPDFIWMDILMPVMDGKTATRKIRELKNGKNTKIVAITASVFSDEKEGIINSGCDDILFKPYHESEIYHCMHQHLGVEFIFNDTSQLINANKEIKSKFKTPNLGSLKEDWLEQFKEATIEGDIDTLHQLINNLPEEQIDLINFFKQFIDGFLLDDLINVLEESETLNISAHEENK